MFTFAFEKGLTEKKRKKSFICALSTHKKGLWERVVWRYVKGFFFLIFFYLNAASAGHGSCGMRESDSRQKLKKKKFHLCSGPRGKKV